MAVTLSSIKILLLEQGSMSVTTNNRILGGGGSTRLWVAGFVPGGGGLCSVLLWVGVGACHGKLLRAGLMTPVLLRAPSPVGSFFLSRNASPEHDVIGINNELALAHACSTA